MHIKKYATSPVVVEAVQLTEENIQEVAEWCGGNILYSKKALGAPTEGIFITTYKLILHYPNGYAVINLGDYVLKRADNYFISYSKRFFEAEFKEQKECNFVFEKEPEDSAGCSES